MSSICTICGKPCEEGYPLCPECYKLSKAGEIVKCKKCGKWYSTKSGCKNCSTAKKNNEAIQKKKFQELLVQKIEEHRTTCLICNAPTMVNKHFCPDCSYTYGNKVLYLQVKNCERFTKLDEEYEGIYLCLDGHKVKSLSEQIIDDYLYENGILHGYECLFNTGIDKEPIRPDFCLKNYLGEGKDVYLEYFGRDGDSDYDQKTDYKMGIYKENKTTLVCMYHSTDGNNLKWNLQLKLNKEKIKEGEINFEKT